MHIYLTPCNPISTIVVATEIKTPGGLRGVELLYSLSLWHAGSRVRIGDGMLARWASSGVEHINAVPNG